MDSLVLETNKSQVWAVWRKSPENTGVLADVVQDKFSANECLKTMALTDTKRERRVVKTAGCED